MKIPPDAASSLRRDYFRNRVRGPNNPRFLTLALVCCVLRRKNKEKRPSFCTYLAPNLNLLDVENIISIFSRLGALAIALT